MSIVAFKCSKHLVFAFAFASQYGVAWFGWVRAVVVVCIPSNMGSRPKIDRVSQCRHVCACFSQLWRHQQDVLVAFIMRATFYLRPEPDRNHTPIHNDCHPTVSVSGDIVARCPARHSIYVFVSYTIYTAVSAFICVFPSLFVYSLHLPRLASTHVLVHATPLPHGLLRLCVSPSSSTRSFHFLQKSRRFCAHFPFEFPLRMWANQGCVCECVCV